MGISELEEFFYSLERSAFIDDRSSKARAGWDCALPIGCEQTISQPSLVLRMTELLELHGTESVLEIGTGSGYQTAFLSRFAKRVYTVERIPELAERAKERLTALGYGNIDFKTGDGCEGWREHAPYERIIVTAAAGAIPEPLADQLAAGGRMVIPVGQRGWQDLLVVHKDGNGILSIAGFGAVTFVELVGRYGWKP
jgi:protein-L-isoaspartate(D-aspartate) O-methyltransferase